MIKIWIRKPISTRAKVIAGATGLILVLIVWVITTTVRMPQKEISIIEYTRLIIPSIDIVDEREFVHSMYSLLDDKYRLNKKKSSKQYLTLWIMLVYTGYSAKVVPKIIKQKIFSKMISKLDIKPVFSDDPDYLVSSTTLQDIYRLNIKSGEWEKRRKCQLHEKMAIWRLLAGSGIPPKTVYPNPILSSNVLSHPLNIIKAFPGLIIDTSRKNPKKFVWKKSLLFAIWVSLRRELIAFFIVLLLSLPIGIFMSSSNHVRAFYMPFLVIGTFIPIAALIPLTIVFFGVNEYQKVIFLTLGMFFVMLGLVMKEMDEVDHIYLETSYTLGFNQFQTMFLVNLPIALPRIWKHFAAIFGLGWGYIIFAEMINVGGSDAVNGIGWLFIIRRRRFQIPDMYAIFFVIIIFAFLFSYLFKGLAWLFFKHERKNLK